MLKFRLALLKGSTIHFWYESLILLDMLLLKAELYLWRFARNRNRFKNAVNGFHLRSKKMFAKLDANINTLKDIRSELNAKIEQIKTGKNND
jgi:hypothetical protein